MVQALGPLPNTRGGGESGALWRWSARQTGIGEWIATGTLTAASASGSDGIPRPGRRRRRVERPDTLIGLGELDDPAPADSSLMAEPLAWTRQLQHARAELPTRAPELEAPGHSLDLGL